MANQIAQQPVAAQTAAAQPVNGTKDALAKPAIAKPIGGQPAKAGGSIFKKWWFWTIIGVVVLGIIGVAVYFLIP